MAFELAPRNESAGRLALAWLTLATAAVAASSLFALLIVLARVPALGTLFPGTEFYRVALTLHVDLSQWVWFMAFAGVLWSLGRQRAGGAWEWTALALAGAGALAMAVSPALGPTRPLMSNYMPVLDSPWFLTGLALYGLAVLMNATAAVAQRGDGPLGLGLRLAAAIVLVALALLVVTEPAFDGQLADLGYFEALFWGPGHVWQFCLTTLMLLSWLLLAPPGLALPSARWLSLLLVLGALPALAAPLLLLVADPLAVDYFAAFTTLMRWASWQVPLAVGLLLLLGHWRQRARLAPGVALSMLLLVCGWLLGTLIAGQTTLVTAHYHGTIGAVTLAFMAVTFRLLPWLGAVAPPLRAQRIQLGLYGWGILLMMAGLAGAGLMGAPRKMPGRLALEFTVETVSRLVLGVGGSLATAGIIMFLVLVLRGLWPARLPRLVRHD